MKNQQFIINVTQTVDKLPEVQQALKALGEYKVMVGVPSDTSNRGGPINNATLAYIHENGAPEANIPARPFLRPAILGIKDQIATRLRATAAAALNTGGGVGIVIRNLTGLGLIAQNAVRAYINSGNFIPLRPSTLAARRRRGRTGTKPLIDTGQLRNAITFVIRRGK